MDITLSENLRALRHEHELTQDALACYLGVSAQSVSKWERGEGYPELAMLPKLAFRYGITVDELLGVGRERIARAIESRWEQSRELENRGDVRGRLLLWREAYEELPHEPEVLLCYVRAMFAESAEEHADEIIRLSREVLSLPDANGRHAEILLLLAQTHSAVNDSAGARACAMELPARLTSSGLMLGKLLTGEDEIALCQENLAECAELITEIVCGMVERGGLDNAAAVCAYEFAINVHALLYEDGDFGFSFWQTAKLYILLAKLHAEDGRSDDALRCAETAAAHAYAFDNARDGQYTSPLADRRRFDRRAISKDFGGSFGSLILKELAEPCFDSIRDNRRFAEAVKLLSESGE